MIKMFENFNNEKVIKDWLIDNRISNYVINDDLTVDIIGSFYLYKSHLVDIPFRFNRVTGVFNCSETGLTTLEGISPKYVGHNFICSGNKLTTLEGSPEYVGGDFYSSANKLTSLKGITKNIKGCLYISKNELTSLEGCPISIGGDFYCTNNKLKDLKGVSDKIDGDFYCDCNDITTLKYLPSIINGTLYYGENPLPKEIVEFTDKNYNDIDILIKNQNDYGIWYNDGTLNVPRWGLFIKDYVDGLLR